MVDEPEGDRLYGLSLEEFTMARDSLAGRLRSAGDSEEAAQVKALRKPTTPAWAVNQLVRRQRPLVEELIAASDRLRRAQQELLAGGSAQQVWEATLAERDILGRLVHEAGRILEGQSYGSTPATLDRISDTLAAAAVDPSGRTLLRRGILTVEMRRAGFGDILGDSPGPAKARVAGSKRAPAAKPKPAAKAARGGGKAPTSKAVLDTERVAARLVRAADRAEEDAERFERAAARAEESADSARKRATVADKEAARARAEASTKRKDARDARREADRAAARLDKLRR